MQTVAEEDTGDPAPSDEPEEVDINNTITFKSIGIDCTEMQLKTLTFTGMVPGRAELTTLDAEFFAEGFRENVSSLPNSIPIGDNGEEETFNCLISMDLPTVEAGVAETDIELNFKSPTGDLSSDLKWALLYPAMFSKQVVNCSPNVVEVAGDRINCETDYAVGTTPTPSLEELDQELIDDDFYEWGSDVLLVYVKGEMTDSFADLGYKNGWNLARLEQSALLVVEPVSELNELSEITINRLDFESRNHIDVTGTLPDTSWPEDAAQEEPAEYSIGALSFLFIEEGSSFASGYSDTISINDRDAPWSFDIYGIPNTEFFLEAQDEIEYVNYYDNWKAYVSVAPFIPLPFSSEQDNILELSDSRFGALCTGNIPVAFLYFQRPNKPSEVLWYQLMELKPGWQAYFGAHNVEGSISTAWEPLQESITFGGDFNYVNLIMGPDCLLPDVWASEP